MAFKYNLSYLGAPVQRRSVAPQPRRTQFVQPCAIFSYHAQGGLSHPSCNPFTAPASSVFGSLSSPATPSCPQVRPLHCAKLHHVLLCSIKKKKRTFSEPPQFCPVVHRCSPHGSVRSLHFPPFLKKKIRTSSRQVKMNASNKERPNDLARQSSDRTQTKHGSILSWSGSACHNFHRTGRSQHPTSSGCRRECMQHKTSLRAASTSLTELERGRGKGQQNQGKLKKGFTHSSAVNKLHNSTSNGPATDYETMQTLFISNTSSAIHNSPPKLVANVGKRHSRTPSHVHGRHAFCPLRLFLAAAAGSWEHGRTKPPRGKVGERERRVYRRKGREEEGRRGGSLVVRRRRCC